MNESTRDAVIDLMNEVTKLRAERDALLAECETWFRYIDPFDMYSEDKPLYEARKAAIDAARKGKP